MSGRGETPDEASERRAVDAATSLSFGQTLYDESGHPIGSIRGIEEGGVFVTTRDGIESLSVQHARSGHTFGQAELMWRCTVCGEMGKIDRGFPETCPGCDTIREDIMYWIED
jgi:hypothetical protein